MTAFDDAMIDLYADPNMGVDVVYTPASGSGRAVRALRSAPDVEIGGPFTARAKGSPLHFDFRIGEVPEMAEGDQVEVVAGELAGTYFIQSAMADDSRLNWKATLRKAA
jgi:hypothetical protein